METRTPTSWPGESGESGFTTTHWSVVLKARQNAPPEAQDALEKLCRAYWYPLYAFVRRQGYTPEEAEDLTQDFFARFLHKDYFRLASPERGRFRCFLLASCKHFLCNAYRQRQTAKRGGNVAFVPWDRYSPEERYQHEPVDPVTPDLSYDRAWALTLLERNLETLRREYAAQGKSRLFEGLQGVLSGERSEQGYAAMGRALGMSEPAVKMAALRLRRRYGELLRAEIAQTVAQPELVDAEIRHLFVLFGG